mgnify:FL=1
MILNARAQRDEIIKTTIEKIAMEILSAVDVDEIAAKVQGELELLQVEDVWARAGANQDGYVEPGDVAWEMFEAVLSPFRDDVEKYRKLSMTKEAT